MPEATLFPTPTPAHAALPRAGAEGAPADSRATRYLAYRPSGGAWLGDVPQHWRTKRLKYAVDLINLKTEDTSGVPYVGLEHIESWTGRRIETEVPVEPEGIANTFRAGDVLFGKLRPYLAKAMHAREGGVCTSEALVMRPRLVAPEYLLYFVLNRDFVSVVDGSTFGSKMPRANWEFIGNLPCPLPPLPEQQAIAGWLDERTRRIDDLVSAKRRLIGLLAEQRTALITHAVTKGLNPHAPMKPTGIDWLGSVPGDVLRLKFLASFVTSGSRGWAEYYSDEGELFLRIGNVSRTGVDLELGDIQRVRPPIGAEGERTVVRGGDVLISVTAYIGAIGVVPDGFEQAYVNQHLALVRPRRSRIEPRYLAYALFSGLGQIQFRQLMYGGTKEGLGLEDVKNLLVIVPPLDGQRAIVAHLDAACARLDALAATAETAILRLTEYRQALISAAVTGKINVCGAAVSARADDALAADPAPTIARRIGKNGAARTANKHFQRSVLAAEIIARIGQDRTFGRVKLQKALILAEGHLQLAEIESQPVRAAAGPFDNAMMRSIQSQLQKSRWYEYKKDGTPLKFIALDKGGPAGGHKVYFDRYWGAKETAFAALMAVLARLTTRQAEIVATLYSAWNDFLIDGKAVTDDALIADVLTNWDPAKTAIPEAKWRAALPWMRSKGLVPTGYGAHTRTTGGGSKE